MRKSYTSPLQTPFLTKSVPNFDSEKIHEIFGRQYILQFFSGVANTVSYQKRAYFDVTSGNFTNFDSEKNP